MNKIFIQIILCFGFFCLSNAAIEGIKSCGGSGTLTSMESTGCTQAPCNLTVNTAYQMGITFTSGQTTDNVIWQVWLYRPEGGVTKIQESAAPGSISNGSAYNIVNEVILNERFAGEPGEIAIMILDGNDNMARNTCGEFATQIQKL